MDYLDFEIEVGQGRGRSYPVVVRSPATGETKRTMRFPFDQVKLESRLKDLEIALLRSAGGRDPRRRMLAPEERAVRGFGQELFRALLPDELRASYVASRREAAAHGKGLRLKLRIQESKLAALPWEFMYDPQHEYVCLDRRTPLVRYLDVPQPIEPLAVPAPLRVLGMIASPAQEAELDTSSERQRVERALVSLGDRVVLTWLPGQTWRDLQRAMWPRGGGPWHIFHFIGHGGFDDRRGEGFIALANETGGTHRLFASQLGILLGDYDPLRLVLLNSCEGARGDDLDVFSSTAATLMQRGIPGVLAMQYEVSDRAAIEFARVFYEAIAHGIAVDGAVTEARKAVSMAIPGSLEWGTPVLYMRAPDGVLFRIDSEGDDVEFGPTSEMRGTPAQTASPPSVPNRESTSEVTREQLKQGYIRGMAAFDAERWEQAVELLAVVVAEEPGYEDASDKLREATRLCDVARLYNEGTAAFEAARWAEAAERFEAIVKLEPAYRDARDRLDESRGRQELADLYGDARRLHQANDWHGVVSIFTRIHALDPAYADADGLLAHSQERLAAIELEERCEALHAQAVRNVDGGEWQQALDTLDEILRLRPDDARAKELRSQVRLQLRSQPAAVSPQQGEQPAAVGGGVILEGVRLWRTLEGHGDWVGSVAFAPDGALLAAGSEDKQVRLWDVADGRLLRALAEHTVYVSSVALAQGGLLATGSEDNLVRLWDIEDGRLLSKLIGHDGWVRSVAFAPDGRVLASGSEDKLVMLWDAVQGSLLRLLEGHGSWVFSVAFAPDGRLLASGSEDRLVQLWDVAQGELLGTLGGQEGSVTSVAFAPDGRLLAAGVGDGTVKLWDVRDGRVLQTLEGHGGGVRSVAFAPDGRLLASGSQDLKVRLWDVNDGRLLRTLEGHSSYVSSVAFAPDGQVLASGSGDGTVRLWRLTTQNDLGDET